MLIRVATDNQGMWEVTGERLLTILVCTCDFFDVTKDHKLGLFSQDAMVKFTYLGKSTLRHVGFHSLFILLDKKVLGPSKYLVVILTPIITPHTPISLSDMKKGKIFLTF